MAQVINTNYLSLTAQNNLNSSQSALSSAIERLSSGLRINSAKDDAAGQAIANRFSANIRGLNQASRNANDGISIAQTTEGALNEINNNIQRIRELTVQAQNSTNSKSDLESIQAEIDQRLNEIDRVSSQTQFNGVKVLARDNNLALQVGANDGERIDIKMEKVTSETLKLKDLNVVDRSNQLGAQVKDGEIIKTGIAGTLEAKITTGGAAVGGGDAKELVEYKTSSGVVKYAIKGNDDKYYGVADIKAPATTTDPVGITASATAITDANELAAISTSTVKTYKGGATDFVHEVMVKLNLKEGEKVYNLTDASGHGADKYVVQTADGKFMDMALTAGTGADSGKSILAAGTTENGVVKQPLQIIDNALAQVDKTRSDLGAVQNRLTSAITNLNNTVNNLSAARSRIEDADYATEVSNMTRAQILQQAGTSVLSQANQVPQNVLTLLR